MVALVLYPSSVFLNRGNHEDIMVTVRYGFHNEVNQKYRVSEKNGQTNWIVSILVLEPQSTVNRPIQRYIQLVTFVFLCGRGQM